MTRIAPHVLAAACALAACRDAARTHETDAAPAVDAAPPAAPKLRAPLEGEWIERVDLPNGGLAFVTPPVGARARRPIVVAVHGAVDDPGLMCSAWRLVTDVFPFVVCPAGASLGHDKYVWRSGAHVAERVREALDAVAARWPDWIDVDAPVVYAAFSQGANMAGRLLASDAKRFRRVVFTEGGYHLFEDAPLARAYASGGGERVLFTCSQPGCAGAFARSKATLEHAGAAARIEYSGPHGHSMPPPVRESIHAVLPWVIAELRGWEAYADAPKLRVH